MAQGTLNQEETAKGSPASVECSAASHTGFAARPLNASGAIPGVASGVEDALAEQWDTPIDFEAAVCELWARRRAILKAGLLAMLVCAIVALLLPPYYTATASFIPPTGGSSGAAGMAASLSALGASGLLGGGKSSSDLYIGILKSRTVADRMIDRFNLTEVYRKKKKSLARKALAKATRFESDIKNPIVSISVTDSSAERSRDMANAYLEELRAASGGMAVTESSQRRLFYEQRLGKEKDDLGSAEVALKQAQEATGLIAPAGQMSSEIQAAAQLRAEITGRQVQLAALQQGETDQNSDLVRLKAEIANLQAHLAEMENGRDARDSGAPHMPSQRLGSQAPSSQHLAAPRLGAESLGGISAARAPGLELEYIRKAREVKYHEALFEIIARQYEAARLDEANNPPVLQVLDVAALPDTREGPPRTVIVAAGLFLGLLGSCLWVLFQAARRKFSA